MPGQVMRLILVDYARAERAHERDSFRQQFTLDDGLQANVANHLMSLALNQRCERLTKLDQRQSRMAELHFFGGLTSEESAEVLGVAIGTVKQDTSIARSRLHSQLSTGR